MVGHGRTWWGAPGTLSNVGQGSPYAAERKAGEKLRELERGKTGPRVTSDVGNNSDYAAALDESGTTYRPPHARKGGRLAKLGQGFTFRPPNT